MEKKPMKPRQGFSPAEDGAKEDGVCIADALRTSSHVSGKQGKIFMPFDALKGLREALAEREQEAQDHIKDFHDLPHWS